MKMKKAKTFFKWSLNLLLSQNNFGVTSLNSAGQKLRLQRLYKSYSRNECPAMMAFDEFFKAQTLETGRCIFHAAGSIGKSASRDLILTGAL